MAYPSAEAHPQKGQTMTGFPVTTVDHGDPTYPSVRSIIIAANTIGLHVDVDRDGRGEPIRVRFSHADLVAQTLMRLAHTWDNVIAKFESAFAEDKADV